MFPSKWTEFWGPSAWRMLHSVSFTFPDSPTQGDKDKYKNFVFALADVLPCPQCRNHANEYLKQNPPDFSSRESFSRWVYDFHESVNERRKVKSNLTYDDVKRVYSGWTASDSQRIQFKTKGQVDRMLGSPFIEAKEETSDFTIVVVVVVLVIIGVIVAKYWKK